MRGHPSDSALGDYASEVDYTVERKVRAFLADSDPDKRPKLIDPFVAFLNGEKNAYRDVVPFAKRLVDTFPDRVEYDCRDITLTFYDRARESSDPTFVQENLRGRVSWTAMAAEAAISRVTTTISCLRRLTTRR